MEKSRTIIISDLHISAGILDDCDKVLADQICQFLESISGQGFATELVINGDFLDFAQAPPWEGSDLRGNSPEGHNLCFTEYHSRQKLKAIIEGHAEVFGSIQAFLGSNESNFLTVLPGNHDADFFWPKVRQDFVESLKDFSLFANRMQFCLEESYHPRFHPTIRVEHGHQYDPVNRFFIGDSPIWSSASPPILRDRRGVNRLFECTGTRFLNLFLNKIDSNYHFVDNVKPFSRFFSLFGRSSLCSNYGPLKAGLASLAMMRYLVKTLALRPKDLLSISEQEGFDSREILAELLARLGEEQQAALMEEIKSLGFGSGTPLFMILDNEEQSLDLIDFIGDHFGSLDILLEEPTQEDSSYLSLDQPERGSDSLLSLGSDLLEDESILLEENAQAVLESSNSTHVVMGHTHKVIDGALGGRYFNTGCWIRYYDEDNGKDLENWEILSEPYDRFPFSLRYVLASQRVELRTFKEDF